MLEFKIKEELKPNKEILEVLKQHEYKVVDGAVKILLKTNLEVITPITYVITYPTPLTIFEYKVNEISSKLFYIKEHNQKYNLKEIKQILKKIS